MSTMGDFTPTNQKRLTNVAYVRLQKGGKRFEIACYRNKALSWRSKVETDINEVLQIDSVFANVSKGMLANVKDIHAAFGTTDKKLVCIEILNKGEIQISEQERVALQEVVFKEIANIVVDKTINPETERPYTIAIIQNAMKQIQYSVSTTKSSKSQALEVIKKLKDIMPIKRTKMLLRIYFSPEDETTIRLQLNKEGAAILNTSVVGAVVDTAEEDADPSEESRPEAPAEPRRPQHSSLDFEIEPDAYRAVEALVKSLASDDVRMEVLQLRTTNLSGSTTTAASGEPSTHHVELAQLRAALVGARLDPSGIPAANVGGASAWGEQLPSPPVKIIGAEVLPVEEASDGEADDVLAHIKKPPSFSKRKEKNREKKLKKKRQQLRASANSLEDPVAEEEGGSNSDSDSDGGDTSAAVEEKRTPADNQGEMSSAKTPAQKNADGKVAGDKQGKRGKRMEKEAKEERAQKAQALQARIDTEAQQALIHQQKLQQLAHANSSSDAAASSGGAGSAAAGSSATVQRCTTCGGGFTDAVLYRQHFRSEWHRYNLTRKLKDLPPVSEEEFVVTEASA